MILIIRCGQRIITNGHIWQHDSQNTLTSHVAVTIISIIIATYYNGHTITTISNGYINNSNNNWNDYCDN